MPDETATWVGGCRTVSGRGSVAAGQCPGVGRGPPDICPMEYELRYYIEMRRRRHTNLIEGATGIVQYSVIIEGEKKNVQHTIGDS